MIEIEFPLNDFIHVTDVISKDGGWPTPSPFNLRFISSRTLADDRASAISGCGIYLISSNDTEEVAYLGMYRPIDGNIIQDRWGRHLQTITGRGFNIGLGGQGNPSRRRTKLLEGIQAPELREAIENSYSYSRDDRFRDTGYSTTPNRLRFASEKWKSFGPAKGSDILGSLTFWFLRIRLPNNSQDAKREVKAVEKRVLEQFKPVCNHEYKHACHNEQRKCNSITSITEAVREAAKMETKQDITYRIKLAGQAASET